MPARNVFGAVDYGHDREHSLAGRGSLSTASVAIQGLIRFLYSIVLGRFLGPVVLAATNSAISLAQFASVLWPAASGNAATKFVARARGAGDTELARASAAHLARSTAGISALLALGTGVYTFFFATEGDLLEAVLVAALTLALSGYTLVRGVYFALGLLSRAVFWDLVAAALSLGLLAGVVLLRWTPLLLVPLILGYGCYAVFGWPRGGSRRLEREERREITGFVFWNSLGTLATSGFLQLSMVIAHAVGTGNESGLYAAALTLATPISLVSSVLTLALFPGLAHAVGREDHASARRQVDAMTRGVLALLGAAFGVAVLLAGFILTLFFGARFADGTLVLQILLVASLLLTINVGPVNALLAGSHRSVRIPTVLSLTGMAVGLLAMPALVPATGIAGVALGYLAGTVISGLGPLVAVWVRERMPWGALLLRAGAGAVLGVALAVAVDLLGWGVLGQFAAAAVFLVVWAVLMIPELRMIVSLRTRSR